jgi:hypothetical protein
VSDKIKCDASYVFSYIGPIWGWASWRRAWVHYDGEMKNINKFMENNYFEYLLGDKLGNIRKKELLNSPKSSWAYPWAFSRHINSGLSCVSSKNLIQNVGFGLDSTHNIKYSKVFDLKRKEINFPLRENKIIVADRDYDLLFLNQKKGLKKFIKWLYPKLIK